MSAKAKQISSPFSTGGGGLNFETRVQAAFTVLMLTGGFAPCPRSWPITKMKLQGKYLGYDTDDLIVFLKEPNGEREARLLAQIKHFISITKKNAKFAEVIQSAWNDFNNPKVFRAGVDAIALVTGPLSTTDMEVRMILEWARHSEDAKGFLRMVNESRLSSKTKREKLIAFQDQLKSANGGTAVRDEKLWTFLKSYHLLAYDLDIQAGVTHSLLHSLIGQYSTDNAGGVWARVIDEVQTANQNAGTITIELLSDELRGHFQRRVPETIPAALTKKIPPPVTVDWCQKPFASELTMATLLGGWDDAMDGDTEIAAQLAKEDFAKWIPKIREVLQDAQSPLTVRNGTWTMSRKGEMWQTLGPRIFDADLDIFEKVAISVLSERDPMFELPPDERYLARIHGKVLAHSHILRKGIADTLALLGSRPKALTKCSLNKPETVAVLVVRHVFDQSDWVLWGSLNNLLPLLAEAAPGEFLDAVEKALQRDPCPYGRLYAQEGDGITGRNYLTGLLWALETLAWDEQHLSRVAVLLGELTVMDPGGTWANRPANSLTTIFLPWFPQTTASVEKRKVAIQTLRKEVPTSAWHALLSLLPNQHQTSFEAHKPIWRQTIPEDWEKRATHKEYWEQVSCYAELAVEMAKEDSARLSALVESLGVLPQSAFDNLLAHLRSSEVTGLPEEERTRLWSALTEFTVRHRRYAGENWVLDSALLDEIDKVAECLTPSSLINLHRRLFSERAIDLYEGNGDWEEEGKKLAKRRQDAVEQILRSGGIEGVLQLAGSVESPSDVGSSLAVVAEQDVDAAILPKLLDGEDRELAQFVGGFVWAKHRKDGWAWVDQVVTSKWTPSDVGQFLTYLPFSAETWKRSDRLLGAQESEYWAKVPVNPFQAEREIETAIDKLLEHNRPNAAIDCLDTVLHRKHPLDRTRTVKALLAAVSTTETLYSMDVHQTVGLIKALQDDSQTNQDDLFKIEWAYLPLLDRHRGASPKLLERRLASEAQFFCEVIRLIFRSRNEDAVEREPTEQQKNLATNAYHLLHEWTTPPGTLPDGDFSPRQLQSWLETVKSECNQSGHLEIALSQIGQVLIHTPPDPDGLWIHQAVAEVLNTKDAEEMRHGFYVGVFNSRGTHFVDPTGKPEKELVEKYTQQAHDAENHGYHRLATAVRGLADSYSREADRIIAEHKEERQP